MNLASGVALTVPILTPLLGAVLVYLLGRGALTWLVLLTIVAISAALAGLTDTIVRSGPVHHALGGWGAPLGIDLYADGLSLVMLWLTAVVGSAISVYALAYFHASQPQTLLFWSLWLLLWAGLNGLFVAADIFNFYVTLEILTLTAVPLVSLLGERIALEAALRYLLYALLGSLIYLLGVALIYAGYGTLASAELTRVMDATPLTYAALALISVGLLTKTAIFPLHIWLPPAHASAPAPVSALLSALVVKGAFYLLLRFWFYLTPQPLLPEAAILLGMLGSIAIFYGSLQALRQTRLKLLIAYSTVAQLGYLLLLFPLAGSLGWAGTLLHAISHGLAKAALFLAAGNMLKRLGHDRLEDLGSANERLPLSFLTFALAGIAIMGLPPSGGFLAKWLLLQAALESGQWPWVVVILGGGLLAAAYVFRVLKLAFPQVSNTAAAAPEKPLSHLLQTVPLVLALLSLVLGLASAPILVLLDTGSPFAALSGAEKTTP